jgi:hypothetical protein
MIGLTCALPDLAGLPNRATITSHSFLIPSNTRLAKSAPVIMASFVVLFTLLGHDKAGAETGYSRGLWYDISGVTYLDNSEQVKAYQRLGIRRVHIMVSHKKEEMAMFTNAQMSTASSTQNSRKTLPVLFIGASQKRIGKL